MGIKTNLGMNEEYTVMQMHLANKIDTLLVSFFLKTYLFTH